MIVGNLGQSFFAMNVSHAASMDQYLFYTFEMLSKLSSSQPINLYKRIWRYFDSPIRFDRSCSQFEKGCIEHLGTCDQDALQQLMEN